MPQTSRVAPVELAFLDGIAWPELAGQVIERIDRLAREIDRRSAEMRKLTFERALRRVESAIKSGKLEVPLSEHLAHGRADSLAKAQDV
jgi:hypothetical protein